MICTDYDGFNGDSTYWVATLNDGTSVYQDDGRPGCEPSSAWLRLKVFCEQNNRWVTGLRVQFRDHIEAMDPNAEGYYFGRGATGILNEDRTFGSFFMGVKKGDVVEVKNWIVPEIIVFHTENRPVSECERGLICAPLSCTA